MGDTAEGTAERTLNYPEPVRRQLQIYAIDPMVARLSGSETVTISVPYEPLQPGPAGELLQVIDFDASADCYYEPVDLEDRRILLTDGLPPSERDPRFHQQMVYAVVSALLENFERGLGRRLRWRGDKRLRAFPHAFRGPNARFDPDNDGSILFGYFRADRRDPGRNLPGQNVFTCLSHDIIVHEATHALVHRLRERYKDPTNLDVYAFHEGFADVVALFQHFTLPDLLARHIQQNRTDLTARSPLVELAEQFGEGSGSGRALRSAMGAPPDPMALARTFEPHGRGSIMVAAVFDAFFSVYQRSIADLLRIATSGTGVLPEGALHPDLVARVAAEARATAQRMLTLCIRSFQFLPPVDVTMGAFLRSAVTADRSLYPADESGLRGALVEAFRRRGIYPDDITSLSEEALLWPEVSGRALPPIPGDVVDYVVQETAAGLQESRGVLEDAPGARRRETKADLDRRRRASAEAAAQLSAYARKNAGALGLDPDLKIRVEGFNASFLSGSRGRVRVEVVIRLVQSAPEALHEKFGPRLGGVPLRGGCTVVADGTGEVRYVVSRAVPCAAGRGPLAEAGQARLAATLGFVDAFTGHDAFGPWADPKERVTSTLNFARIDGGW